MEGCRLLGSQLAPDRLLSAGQKEFSPLILAGLVAGGVTCLALVANQGESLAELQVPPV